MKIISCENFALQADTLALSATSDIVVRCGNTGKRYYRNGSAWAEYFDFSPGGNVTVTPLAQALPRASISDRKVIDTPYSAEIINNYNLITGEYAMPTVGTYARAFVAPHTGLYSSVKFIVGSTPAGGGIFFGIYNDSGILIAQDNGVADSTMSNGWTSQPFWKDGAGNTKSTCGVVLTGGQLYYIGYRNSSLTSKVYGFNNLPTTSIASNRKPIQGFSSVTPPSGTGTASTLTFNVSNQAIFPYVTLEIIQ